LCILQKRRIAGFRNRSRKFRETLYCYQKHQYGYLVEQYNAGINIPSPQTTLLTKAFFDISKIWKDRQNYEKICGNAVKMVEEAFDWNNILDEMNTKLYNC
jgi:hypothetical protein